MKGYNGAVRHMLSQRNFVAGAFNPAEEVNVSN
jgi:hypothetical protein